LLYGLLVQRIIVLTSTFRPVLCACIARLWPRGDVQRGYKQVCPLR